MDQNKNISHNSEKFLREVVSKAIKGYEIRPSQLMMMNSCAANVESGGILLAEAGTGTGKTYAYVTPIIMSGKKAIVSTNTLNLQAQLASKDLRLLKGLKEFNFAVAKGRANYICLRRLRAFKAATELEFQEHRMLIEWVSNVETGDQEDLETRKSPSIWNRMCSDSDACPGEKCRYYGECFYYAARCKCVTAQIIVTNHTLLGINAARGSKSKILPKAEVLVIDEAHTLDHALSAVIGTDLTNLKFAKVLRRLFNPLESGIGRGILSGSPHLYYPIVSLGARLENLWKVVGEEFRDGHMESVNCTFVNIAAGISSSIRTLIAEISNSAKLYTEDAAIELDAALRKLKELSNDLEIFTKCDNGFVRWIELDGAKTAFRMLPLYPRDFFVNRIIPAYKSVVLTSATLSVSGDFSFLAQVLGLEKAEKISLPSPFDFKRQIHVEIKKGIDLKKDDGPQKLARVIIEEASRKEGGILVLFTSREIMNRAWELCNDELENLELIPMLQGALPKKEMLNAMRGSKNSVIFGLDSFWEGVDVPGDSLKSLIITKLPFDVPTEPLVQARVALIEEKGGNAFYDYTIPRAVLKFKQGVGRLIRSKKDSGRVIICDERVETKPYGHAFIRCIS